MLLNFAEYNLFVCLFVCLFVFLNTRSKQMSSGLSPLASFTLC